jgi:hypothetical protein
MANASKGKSASKAQAKTTKSATGAKRRQSTKQNQHELRHLVPVVFASLKGGKRKCLDERAISICQNLMWEHFADSKDRHRLYTVKWIQSKYKSEVILVKPTVLPPTEEGKRAHEAKIVAALQQKRDHEAAISNAAEEYAAETAELLLFTEGLVMRSKKLIDKEGGILDTDGAKILFDDARELLETIHKRPGPERSSSIIRLGQVIDTLVSKCSTEQWADDYENQPKFRPSSRDTNDGSFQAPIASQGKLKGD